MGVEVDCWKNIVLLEILYDFFEEILLIGSKFYFIQFCLSLTYTVFCRCSILL